MMCRRARPTKRVREKRRIVIHRARLLPARLFRIWPDRAQFPHAIVEVRFCRDTRRLVESTRQQGWPADPDDYRCAGMVRDFGSRTRPFGSRRMVLHGGRVVAQMWLSVRDVRQRQSEIVSHECGHAAMAWARWRGANLDRMPGEEVMCYALGRMVAQVNRICYAAGAFA